MDMANKQSIYQSKYDAKNIQRVSLKLHVENDKDIIKAIDNSNKQGSVKELIRDGIKYRQVNK